MILIMELYMGRDSWPALALNSCLWYWYVSSRTIY